MDEISSKKLILLVMSVFATAEHPYTAEEDTELSFNQGDVIEILDACQGDW